MHPSLFELDVFVRRGATSPSFERHVSDCAACATRLSQLARRAHAPALVLSPAGEQPFHGVVLALTVCLAVLLLRAPSWMTPPPGVPAPEGVHGVVLPSFSQLVSAEALSDAGALDSGMR
jgi:hypothetical protein